MTARKPKDAAELLDLLIDRAPQLRRAGVLEVAIDGFTAKLAPPQRAAPTAAKVDPPPKLSALDDPETFGLPPGAKLPNAGFEADG